MTKTTTVLFDVPPAIKTALSARAALDEIPLNSGPVAGRRDPDEWIVVGPAEVSREPRSFTGQRLGGHDETGSVPIDVQVTVAGAGEDVIDALRERMLTLIGECEAAICVDPTLGGVVQWAYPSGLREIDQGIEPPPKASHWMVCEMTVTFRQRIYPGEAL
jgi:hypothetical protein